MKMAQGDPMVPFSSNLANAMWAALAVSIALPYFLDYRRKRKSAQAPS